MWTLAGKAQDDSFWSQFLAVLSGPVVLMHVKLLGTGHVPMLGVQYASWGPQNWARR